MREVSCRALGVLLKAAKNRPGADAVLLEGITYDLDYLRNTKNRIEWSVWCRILRNAGRLWSPEELSDVNEAFMSSPFFGYVGVIARMLFNARDLFNWVAKSTTGAGAQLFSNTVTATYQHVGDDMTIIRLEVAEGYEPSPEFFWMTRGAFIAIPRLVWAGSADVDLDIQGNVGTFRCRYKTKRALSSLLRWIMLPFTARAAAKELKAANEELQERYTELEDARAKLDFQATRLRTAYTISELVNADLEHTHTVDAIVRALVEQAGYEHARIKLTGAHAAASFGTPGSGERLERLLVTGQGAVGQLEVQCTPGSRRFEREELLAFLAPTLAMALQNALAYRELNEYKLGLEKIVDQRTTELRQARDQLAGTVEQLRAAQEVSERFFSNISHEIRTPLTLILLAVGDIQRRFGDALDERGREGLVAVSDSARKLLRLVDELLLLAAGQADKLQLSIETVDMTAIIAQLVAAWRPAADSAGVELHARVADKLLANVDPVAFERIASNLLSNAVKYTPRGGRVDIELVVEAEHVRLSVLDTGPGIDADLATRLFGRFERAAGSDRRKAGTGIGLALVKQLVDAHEGSVAAVPRASGGTEMRVLLPSAIVETQQQALPPTFLRAPHAPSGGSTVTSGAVYTPPGLSAGTILIAEDEPRLAEAIAELLHDRYTVIVALDGHAACDLVAKHQPQLLITDVDMPGMNGIELARKFRELTGDRLAPIVILSALLDLRTRLAGLEAGAIDYVGKPFDPNELKARVNAQFRMRDMALRLHRAEQLSAMGILTSGLAHELRNPANGIVNALAPLTELLPHELIGPDTGAGQLLDVLKSCAEQIGFLTRQLLGFRNNDALELRSACLLDLVRRATKMAHRALMNVDVRIEIDRDGEVLCAPPLFVQVLTNLIENAGHAAGPGGWVEIRASAAGSRVTLEVTDSGKGVPLELRERVFEPFFTTKAPGVGTGLGLALARTIIHKHGGVLEIRERAGKTVFVVELGRETNIVATANAV